MWQQSLAYQHPIATLHLTLLSMANLNSMTRGDLVLILKTYGEEPPTSWTRMDLRHRVGELVESKEIEVQTGKKSGTMLEKAVSELNKASRKKADLIHHAQTNLLLNMGPNATIPVIQKAAMEKLLTEIAGEDNDLMGFGKFAGRTYLDVKTNEAGYCQWAKTIYKEENTSLYLKRFVEYLLMPDSSEKKKIPIKCNPKKMAGKAGYMDPKVKTEEEAAPSPKSSAASSSTEATVTQLTKMVGELIAEVKELKEEKAAAIPRKIAVKSDVTMGTSSQDFR